MRIPVLIRFFGFATAFAVFITLTNSMALAGEAHKNHNVNVIKVHSGDGDAITLKFENESGVSDLADGESRTIVAESGEAVTVTRNGNTLSILTSSGESIDLPFVHDDSTTEFYRADSDGIEKRIKIKGHSMTSGEDMSTMLITSKELSEQQKAIMSEAAQRAGINDELEFIGADGKNVRIKKKSFLETEVP